MHILSEDDLSYHQHPDNNYLSVPNEKVEDTDDSTNSIDSTSPINPINQINPINPNLVVVAKIPMGRTPGATGLAPTEQLLIANLAQTEKQSLIAKTFGVCDATVSNYKYGKTVHGRDDSAPELKKSVETTLDKITDIAIERLFNSIDSLSVDDIACLGAKDKADVAVKMSKVVDNIRGKNSVANQMPQVVIYAPQIIDESRYKTIEV